MGTWYIADGNVNGAAIVENRLVALHKVKQRITNDTAIPLLGVYPKELNTGTKKIQVHICS